MGGGGGTGGLLSGVSGAGAGSSYPGSTDPAMDGNGADPGNRFDIDYISPHGTGATAKNSNTAGAGLVVILN
jgi:hypothetical protein